jgi:serine/threonine protein kinase
MSATSPRGGGEGEMFGRYRLVRELGRGGMGVAYRAVSEGPQGFARNCVIKRIVPHLSSDAGFISSLVAEAKLSGMLVHPGIVQVYELGQVDGEYYVAMEYVDGLSLWQAMKRCLQMGRTMPPGVVAYLIAEMAVALGYAHSLDDDHGRPLGIVHRDVSPSNVMLGRSGTVKLLDFGIARAAGQLSDHATRTGTLKGKFAYMSPEQADGHEIDLRSDLFALGVIFWEALTLRRLFSAADDMQTLRMVREAKVTPTGIDPKLDEVLLKLLARTPDARWSSGDDVAAALQPIAHRLEGNTFSTRRFVGELLAVDPKEPLMAPAAPAPGEATQLSGKRVATQTPRPTTTNRRIAEAMGTTPPSRRGSDGTTPSLVPATGGSGYEIKGSIVRSYTGHIEAMGILPTVLSQVTPETRKLMTTEMPLSNVWVDAGVIEDMIGKVEALKGLEGVRTITRAGIYTGALPVLKPVVVPMLRLFGMSPHTLLSRFGQFTKNNLRGMDLLWTPEGDRAGNLRVTFPRRTPRSAYIGFESGIWVMCELCSVKGEITDTEIRPDGCVGIIRLKW